jgi:hypothetical protein
MKLETKKYTSTRNWKVSQKDFIKHLSGIKTETQYERFLHDLYLWLKMRFNA